VVEHCQGLSRNKAAEKVAGYFDGTDGKPTVSASSFKSQVSKNQAYGALINQVGGDSWEIVSLPST
jgi:hypothetical protein